MDRSLTAYLLNMLDLIFTLYAVHHGGVELNPFMQSVPVMITYKVIVVGALLWWMSGRKEPIARKGMKTITAVYSAINLWHIVNFCAVWAA